MWKLNYTGKIQVKLCQFQRSVSTLNVFSHPSANINIKQMKKLSTPELLIKLGFISQPNSGLTHWLPLGKETLDNVSNIIHKHHRNEGCVEVSLSSISHSSLWSKTNRWGNNELFKIGDYCLAATAEEEITSLVTPFLNSYKKMPFIVYQLTRKYRNEKRSRGGLLRGREFVMKDAYSFDSSKKEALESFNKMNEIYAKIFTDLKLPFIKANADSGDIGGDLSYEWHIVSDVGEDTVVECDNCGACGNVERVRSLKKENEFVDESDVSYYLNENKELICIYYPKGRKLSLKFVKEEDLVDIDETAGDGKKVLSIFEEINGENDNLMTIYRLCDINVGPGTKMPDLPVPFSKNHMITFQGLDITEAQEGDICSNCEKGKLKEMKGVEVGHTFYLGTKYSEPLEGKFIDKDDVKKNFEMGCYGIGVSRLVGVIAEVLRDGKGLRWPASVAPLHVSVIKTGGLDEGSEKFTEFIDKLENSKVKFEIDDSEDIGFGKKLTKSKMLGIPLQVIIGKRFPLVEIEVRGVQFSDNFREVYEVKKEEWGWNVEKDRDGNDKHLVNIEYADQVIETLLKDM